MQSNRVRKGGTYILEPVLLDHEYWQLKGTEVRVVEAAGCPRSKMPKCFAHVEIAATGQFLGMVHTNSLVRKEVSRG